MLRGEVYASLEGEAPSSATAAPRPAPRVAILTSLYPPSVGGIQSHTFSLARALAARGAEVHVVTRRSPGCPAHAVEGRLHVHRVGAPPGAPGPLATLAYVVAAARRVASLRPRVDVVHAHQLLSPSSAALLLAALTGTPILLNPHACGAIGDVGVLSATALGRLRLRATVARADAFVAISGPIHAELRAAGVPPERILSIPNGVDLERFRPAAAEERAALRRALGLPAGPLVVYAGRLSPEKGVDVLARAWPRVVARLPEARLWMLGDGAERARLEELARREGVETSLALPGPVADVAPFLRAADAAVLPSRTEGMPVALLEAMACAVPVVATAVGGSAEVLRDGVTGRLVPPERPGALADALVEALRDPAAQERARAAREEVAARYGLDHVAEVFLEVYSRLRRDPAAAGG
ncbi:MULTISPECIES: glycosyltransferase family 4 protein [unclassified Anaeromyxobacter]|uniref:glycosyltransferase family 4 protein n=1 Tax=unclassified Anaeromyxobacter TaxID=2620896 RepID=UPI001F57EF6A|nr:MULTISPECIES: glycosyltransferase family 4 protein [unclassified Anaeromyxobacter]